jgi:hypothetical protein
MQLKALRVAIAFVVSSSSAIACTASENFDIYFSRNSDEMANDEIIRLANWVVDKQIAYANHKTSDSTLVSGHAEEDEHDPASLATKRLGAGMVLIGN